MPSDDQLLRRLRDREASNVERTSAARDQDKFAAAICAFANVLPDTRETGVLFIGVHDDGRCAGIEIGEQLLQTLAGFRTDGNITPFPVMHVRKHKLDDYEMVVVEVEPSDNPPLKYKGRVCIRIAGRRGYATAEEERRLTEKRRWGTLPFDQQPISRASIQDLDKLQFRDEYLTAAIAPDVLAENAREIDDQLRSLRFLTPDGRPTAAGLLVCGRDPRAWLPGAYV